MKKILAIILSCIMTVGGSVCAFAKSNEDGTEKALKMVKDRIGSTDKYETFYKNVSASEGRSLYDFHWEGGNNGNETLNVTINDTGIISSYSYYNNSMSSNCKPSIKKVSLDEVYAKACEYVKKLNPDICNNLKVINNVTMENITNDSYYFDLQRYENNIPVVADVGYVAVSPDGSTLTDFYLTYTQDIKFDDNKNIISIEQAKKAYSEKIGMSLCYDSRYDDNDNISAISIYSSNDEYMKYISAISGDVVKLTEEEYYPELSQKYENDYEECSYEECHDYYSDAENDELEAISGLLSQADAEKLVRNNKIIDVPKNYALKSIYGSRNGDYNDEYTYNLSFASNTYKEYIDVTIDAQTGEIMHFYKLQSKGNKKTDDKNAEEIAKKAIEVLSPEHVKDYILQKDYSDDAYYFIRNVNGIPFSANQIRVLVDKTNGNVSCYNYFYNDIEFPSIEKVISKKDALNKLFENSEYSLYYVPCCSKEGMSKYDKAALVYKFGDDAITQFDACTGKPMWDNSNNEISNYTDISGNRAEKAITTLKKYGIMYDSAEFQPEKEITQKEFISFITSVLYDKCAVTITDDFDYSYEYSQARCANIITEADYAPDSIVTKENAAVLFSKALNINEYAELEGLYICPFKDVNAHIGQISILNAMKVLCGDENGSYNPQKPLTRADCAMMLYNYLIR